ncbi:Uncharacterised protein [Enterobacter cloacae]|nr:Uncharacterised protein [Enterobacter cloacae]
MVRRARRGAEGAHLLNQVVLQLARGKQRFGFLIEIGFVGRTAAFGDTEEFVLITVDAVEVNLCWQVGAGVDLFVHVQRGVLRIAQVVFGVGVINTVRQRRFITAAGPDALAFFTDDDRRTGILTGWQNAFRRDIGVTQELQGNVLIVFAGFRVTQNIGHLLLMGRTEHKRGVVESVLRQQRQRLRIHLEDLLSFKLRDGDVIAG